MWYDMIWYGMIWYGMIWFDNVYIYVYIYYTYELIFFFCPTTPSLKSQALRVGGRKGAARRNDAGVELNFCWATPIHGLHGIIGWADEPFSKWQEKSCHMSLEIYCWSQGSRRDESSKNQRWPRNTSSTVHNSGESGCLIHMSMECWMMKQLGMPLDFCNSLLLSFPTTGMFDEGVPTKYSMALLPSLKSKAR